MGIRPCVEIVRQFFGDKIDEVKELVLKQCLSADPSSYVNLETKPDGRVPRQLNCWMIFKTEFHKQITNQGLYEQICTTFNIPGKERLHMIGDIVKDYWNKMKVSEKAPFVKLAKEVDEEMRKRVPDYKDERKRKPSKDPFRPYDVDERKKDRQKKQSAS
ncbi:15720_t:CDS:1, partial [Gigaspora rosea]